MRVTLRQLSLLLVLLQCMEFSHGVRQSPTYLETKLSKSIKEATDRKLKKSKSKSDDTPYNSPVAWSPAMSPSEYYQAYYGTEKPTDEPTDKPTDKPTDEPTDEPTPSPFSDALASGNIFDVSPKQDDASKTDTLEASSATLDTPRYIVAHVSVAFSRSVSSSDIKNKVAKVTTKVIRSYTPFMVYMLDGSRRKLQNTDLEYDPKFSSMELAYGSAQVSWWTYNVAYKVTKIPEEQEEAKEIDDLAESAVEASILSGLFLKLLTPIAPEVRGVSVPEHELDQDLEPPTNVAGAQPPDKVQETQRNRSVGIGLAILCVCVLLVSVVAFAVANRRRRCRAAEAVWAINMGDQKKRGQILSAEWTSAYNYEEEDEPMLAKGAFTLAPRDPPGVYMLGGWEHATASGTEEVSARDGSLSIGNGSYT